MLFVLLALIACSSSSPQSLEECGKMSPGASRDECYVELLPELFASDPERADELTRTQLESSQTRDFVYLAVTRRIDPSTLKWCDKIQEPVLKERCQVLVTRPHLHRDLIGGEGHVAPPRAPEAQLPGSAN